MCRFWILPLAVRPMPTPICRRPISSPIFRGAGFDASLLSFLEIGRDGSVNVSKLSFRPHVTAGAGGFVDITARAKKIVFSGMFNAGAKLSVTDGKLVIEKEGKLKKLVNAVEHVTFSGPRGVEQGRDVTYVTERAVMKLTPQGIVLTEIAPGVDLQAHILDQAEFPLIVSDQLKLMDEALFREEPIGLTLPQKPARKLEA
ncbi:coenzyme A transferase [Brucella abortus bv. 6 str. 870]|nr:coenzyme A transferase [Brucella abortus bv. 6 str. 870]EEX83464.1 coenzyme A transferase [Brucella abortus bv. 3 str. Tulya]